MNAPADRLVAAVTEVQPVTEPVGAAHLDDRIFIACGLAWAAGLIHAQAAVDHIQEYALYAVFFALLWPAQFAWGIAVCRRPRRSLLHIGAAVSLAIVALWVASRTSGLPIGPQPWKPEPVGAIDAIASADEIALALLVLLPSAARGRVARASRLLAMGAGIGLILLSSVALVGAGHGH